MATNTSSISALSDDEVDIIGDSISREHDLKEILRQIASMGKKLDMLISTVGKLTSTPRGTNEVGDIHKKKITTVL